MARTLHEPTCTGVKTCSSCGEAKPVLAFATDKKMSDGVGNSCRECTRVKTKERYKEKKAKILPASECDIQFKFFSRKKSPR